jgi:ribonuclease E
MSKKLLIDASHSEEIRVAIVRDKNLEEFDSETIHKKILKGNIYLAKVMRVEPSLQAAFVEYGNGRQGFLPFSEIHPDYYQIPVADREEVLKNQAYELPESYDSSPEVEPNEDDIDLHEVELSKESENEDIFEEEINSEIDSSKSYEIAEDMDRDPSIAEQLIIQELGESPEVDKPKVRGRKRNTKKDAQKESDEDQKQHAPKYQYKIQEVIKRRQILLVQVIKEERGNKGAAVTTYLSLAGRYCVLMPNAGRRNGGISKKIDDSTDRTRLKEIINSLSVPEGMSLIIRTAGQEKRKTDIKRDYEYLVSIWNKIRERTLESMAPALIHEEGNLITRALRDMYDPDINEILIEGEEAYKSAKNLMRLMIPSHCKKVQHYKNPMLPLFHAYSIEQQMNSVMNPICSLPSGGYIVLNTTEALVAIDVNSGRSTKERHIDETALKTNLEAADQVARQLRLRDLSGLVVIDFIDMHDPKHIQQVERRFKEATKNDRARLQIGRISQFGLLELSRQRLRPSLMENHATQCPHCEGTGYIRSTESCALQILRAIEGEAVKGGVQELLLQVPPQVDLYLLNQKRRQLVHIESRFNLSITIERDHGVVVPNFNMDVIKGHLLTEGQKVEEQVEEKQIVEIKEEKHKEKRYPVKKNKEFIQQENKQVDEGSQPDSLDQAHEKEHSHTFEKKKHHHNRFRNKRHKFNRDKKHHSEENVSDSLGDGSPKNNTSVGIVEKQTVNVVLPINDNKPDNKVETGEEKKSAKQPKKPKSWLRRLLEN